MENLKSRSEPVCEGYSAARPIDEEDLQEEVFYWLARGAQDRSGHNLDGWFAEAAGSEKCLALGHKPKEDARDEFDEWDDDNHPYGWFGFVCAETRWGQACTVCESDDCFALSTTGQLWEAVAKAGADS
jgi:hypothetical protein